MQALLDVSHLPINSIESWGIIFIVFAIHSRRFGLWFFSDDNIALLDKKGTRLIKHRISLMTKQQQALSLMRWMDRHEKTSLKEALFVQDNRMIVTT